MQYSSPSLLIDNFSICSDLMTRNLLLLAGRSTPATCSMCSWIRRLAIFPYLLGPTAHRIPGPLARLDPLVSILVPDDPHQPGALLDRLFADPHIDRGDPALDDFGVFQVLDVHGIDAALYERLHGLVV